MSVIDEEEVLFEDFWKVQQSHSKTSEEKVENSPAYHGNLPSSPPLSSFAHFIAYVVNMGDSTTSLD